MRISLGNSSTGPVRELGCEVVCNKKSKCCALPRKVCDHCQSANKHNWSKALFPFVTRLHAITSSSLLWFTSSVDGYSKARMFCSHECTSLCEGYDTMDKYFGSWLAPVATPEIIAGVAYIGLYQLSCVFERMLIVEHDMEQ